jgi:hypothetical protein
MRSLCRSSLPTLRFLPMSKIIKFYTQTMPILVLPCLVAEAQLDVRGVAL